MGYRRPRSGPVHENITTHMHFPLPLGKDDDKRIKWTALPATAWTYRSSWLPRFWGNEKIYVKYGKVAERWSIRHLRLPENNKLQQLVVLTKVLEEASKTSVVANVMRQNQGVGMLASPDTLVSSNVFFLNMRGVLQQKCWNGRLFSAS